MKNVMSDQHKQHERDRVSATDGGGAHTMSQHSAFRGALLVLHTTEMTQLRVLS